MRIGLIADIHANLPALEAVLEHCKYQNVEAIWNAGDFIGYGAFPEEVIQRVRDDKIMSILGNYDRKVLRLDKKSQTWRDKKNPLKLFSFQWAAEQLTMDSRIYLASLLEEIRLHYLGKKILLVHGSPASRSEHLTANTNPARFIQLSKMAKSDIIIFGHSHMPFAHQLNNTWFINPGSVGRPDDGDYRASYAVLEISKSKTLIQHHRLEYDLSKSINAMIKYKFPPPLIEMFRKGRNLDTILALESKQKGKYGK